MGYLAKSAYFERGLLAEDKWEQITLPIIVIAEMLGVAARDLAQFKRWSDARSQIFNKARTPEQTAESAAARQGLEARGGLSGDRIQIPRDRGFADSPLEGSGFELAVPREKWAARISSTRRRWRAASRPSFPRPAPSFSTSSERPAFADYPGRDPRDPPGAPLETDTSILIGDAARHAAPLARCGPSALQMPSARHGFDALRLPARLAGRYVWQDPVALTTRMRSGFLRRAAHLET